jgi:hypothetical protein
MRVVAKEKSCFFGLLRPLYFHTNKYIHLLSFGWSNLLVGGEGEKNLI